MLSGLQQAAPEQDFHYFCQITDLKSFVYVARGALFTIEEVKLPWEERMGWGQAWKACLERGKTRPLDMPV